MISSVEHFLQDFANGGHADNGDFLGHLDTGQRIFGGIDLGKAQFSGFVNPLFNPIDAADFTCQTDFAYKALLWVGRLILITGGKGNCDR